MTEDLKAKIKRLAEKYAMVSVSHAAIQERTELHAAIDSIDARGEAVVPANGTVVEVMAKHGGGLWQALDIISIRSSTKDGYTVFVSPAPLCASQGGGGAELPAAIGIMSHVGAEYHSDVFFATLEDQCTWEDFIHAQGKNAALRSPLPGRESTAQAGAGDREDFEAWMVSEGYGEVPRICLPGSPCAGEYANQYWHRSWVAWQAGRARAAARGGKPTPNCNWGMLDTTAARAALASSARGSGSGDARAVEAHRLCSKACGLWSNIMAGPQAVLPPDFEQRYAKAKAAETQLRRYIDALAASPTPTPEPHPASSQIEKLKLSAALERRALDFEVILARFHSAVWEAGADEDGRTDYDLAGLDEAKVICGLYRRLLAQVEPLTRKQKRALAFANRDITYVYDFVVGFDAAERAHGIGSQDATK